MKSIKRVFFFFKIVISVLKKKTKTGRHGDIHPVAQSMESSQAPPQGAEVRRVPSQGLQSARGGGPRLRLPTAQSV